MYLAGASGYGLYTTLFKHFMADNMARYGEYITLSTIDSQLLSTLNSQLSTLNFDAERHVRNAQADLRPDHLGVGFHDLCIPAARYPACSNRHRESAALACLWHQTPVSLAINNKNSHKNLPVMESFDSVPFFHSAGFHPAILSFRSDVIRLDEVGLCRGPQVPHCYTIP